MFLKGDPAELRNPIGIGKKVNLKPQAPRYARLEDIRKAKSLDDVFGISS